MGFCPVVLDPNQLMVLIIQHVRCYWLSESYFSDDLYQKTT